MEKEYNFNRIIRFGEIHDENNLEIALFCHRLLRVMAKENPKLKTIRKRLGNTIKDYEKKNWSASSSILAAQIIESRPQLNGKVERSHLTDKREFYQLLSYSDEVDLNKRIKQWEDFYKFDKPQGAFKGKTPCEILIHHLKK